MSGNDENVNVQMKSVVVNKQLSANLTQRSVTVGATGMSGLSKLISANCTQYKVLMNKMEPSLIDGLCKLIREGNSATSAPLVA
jgi:competence protein ComGC